MTLIECDEDIVVIDCGQAFPGEDMPGVDSIINNFDYLRQNREKLRGVVLTHGHEDHIGALAYFLQEFNVPVYGTLLTIALVNSKLEEFGLKTAHLEVIEPGDSVPMGEMSVEFIRTNHSIGDAVAMAVTTGAGVVIHTGDFKIDYTPIHGEPINLQRFAELGRKGVLALMSDSTNAERPGFTMSESTVGRTFLEKFAKAEGRILVATFASNVDRLQQIINAAYHFGRKVAAVGRSMVNVINTAIDIGYLEIPENTLIDITDVNKYDDADLVIVTTGSQGEPMAALSRMAKGEHKIIEIKPGDTVIFSSKPVPGNEKTVNNVINELMRRGADVTYENAHVSGHASQEELKVIYKLVQPKYFIPVHGEFRHLKAHAGLVEALGHDKDAIVLMHNGCVLQLDAKEAKIVDEIECAPVLVDGLGVGDVGSVVLHDRKILSEEGLMIVVCGVSSRTGSVIAGPDIISRGFVYVKESEAMLEHCRVLVRQILTSRGPLNTADWSELKSAVKEALRAYLWNELNRSPMILPIILDVKELG